MKAVETLLIFVCVFLVTWSAGDGAPQWRPQGRFGKRFSSTRTNSDIMSALQTVADDNDDQFGQMFLNDPKEFQMLEDRDTVDEIFSNSPAAISSSSSSSSPSSIWPFAGSRICIETSFPGVFKCHRKGRSGSSIITMEEKKKK